MSPTGRLASRARWHYLWAATVIGALLLNVFWPVYPGFAVWALSLIAYPVAAAVILSNRPGNRVGRVLAVAATAGGLIFIGGWAAWTWQSRLWSSYLEAGLGLAIPVLFWGLITLLYVFPTGHLVRGASRAVFIGFTVVIIFLTPLALFGPGPLPLTGRTNPMGGPSWVGAVFDAGIVVLIPGLFGGMWSTFVRYRTAGPEGRLQLKWFLVGIILVVGLITVVSFIPDDLPNPYEVFSSVVVVAGFWALPAAIVIAITRHRLYVIDRLVSRTISYSVIVSAMAGVFALGIVGLQALLPTRSSDIAVAGSTLAAAALFNPLRRRVLSAVDRRFDRSHYRAEEVVARVSERLKDAVDPVDVIETARSAIIEVFTPNGLAAWVADRTRPPAPDRPATRSGARGMDAPAPADSARPSAV